MRARMLSVKAEETTGPSVCDDSPDHVLALDEQVSHVIGLVKEPFE